MFDLINTKFFYTVQIFLGYECNLDCKFCFVRNKNYNIPTITYNQFCNAVNRVLSKGYSRSCNEIPIKISITGGEPSLHPDFDKMLDYLKKKRAKFEIYSNGLKNFDPKGGEVRLRYDGYTIGEKPMNINNYTGKYSLGLIVNGGNTEELIKCLNNSNTDTVTITDMIDLNGSPVCGVDAYLIESQKIVQYIDENIPQIKTVEISVGRCGIYTGSPVCRWERYFGGVFDKKCPAEIDENTCKSCKFQKLTYKRRERTIDKIKEFYYKQGDKFDQLGYIW